MLSFGKRSLSSYSLLLGTGNAIFHYDSQWYQQKKKPNKKTRKKSPQNPNQLEKKKKRLLAQFQRCLKTSIVIIQFPFFVHWKFSVLLLFLQDTSP